MSRRGYLAASGVGIGLVTAGCLSGESELEMGVIPDVDPDTAIEKNDPLKNYLESNIDATIKMRVASDYSGVVQAMASNQIDFAYFGGLSYILAHQEAEAQPIVVGAEAGSTMWHSQFLAHPSTGFENMEDMIAAAGETKFAFGDPISTSGTMMPIWYMRQEYDFKPREEFSETTNTGAHDATAQAVKNESTDAGSLNAKVYDRLVDDGDMEPGSDVIEIWRSPGFPDYPWAVSGEMDDGLQDDLQSAFVELDDRNESDILEQLGVDQFVETDHGEFESLENAATQLGFMDEI